MFEKKKVSQLVSEFLEKVSSREAKVEENVNKLKAKAEGISKSVAEQTAAMIECELQDDATGAEKLRKSTQVLRAELAEVKASIQAYSNQSVVKNSYSKQLSEIRAAAVREEKENQEQVQSIYKQKDDIDKQIKELQAKRDQLSVQQEHIKNAGPEQSLTRILCYIDPRADKLDYLATKRFLQSWINKANIEHHFAEKPAYAGVSTTEGVIQQSKPKPVVHTKRFQVIDKQAAFDDFKAKNPKAEIVEIDGLDRSQQPLEIHYTVNE